MIESSDEQIREIAQKAHKEVLYHLRRSTDLIVRLGDGTPESHKRMQKAIDDAWFYLGELFLDDEVTEELAQRFTRELSSFMRQGIFAAPGSASARAPRRR